MGTGFAEDGGNVTIASSATDLTFSSVVETSATTATASFADTGTAAGTYTATLTDDNGSTGAVAGAVIVDAAPTISGVSPGAIFEGCGANVITVAGAQFQTGATVSITNSSVTGGAVDGNGTPLTATVTTVTSGTITLSVTPTNAVTNATASPGTYWVTVTNPDGGSVTDGTTGTGPLVFNTAFGT